MGFVEPVAREFFHQVEDMRRLRLTYPAGDCAADKHRALLGHFLGLFLAHRPAQEVGAAERVARQRLGDLHDLFLVEDHAVGRLERGLELRMQVIDPRTAGVVLARDEILDHARLQRAGAKQRHERDDVAEAIRLQAADQVLHAARLELEHGRGAAVLQQLVGRSIVHRQHANIDRRLAGERALGIDVAHGPVDDRQRAQPQEVELDEPGRLDIVLVELRDRGRAAIFHVQRREIRQHRGRDHNATRMRAGVARQALERAGKIDQLMHLRIIRVEPRQLFFLLERLVERDADLERDQLGDAIDVAIVMPQHSPHVAHDRLGGEAPVRNDLRDPVAAVLGGHVLDDAIAPFHAEIHVEVRHRDAFRVQKALEQQVVLDRVQVRNA